jgi:Zn-dependent membrane protease YugP
MQEADGDFDIETFIDGRLTRRNEAVGSSLTTGNAAARFLEHEDYLEAGLRKKLSTGAQVALRILREHEITDVTVVEGQGFLSDHYDPRTKVLRLSPDVYNGYSMAAFGVAAHEVGHAIQHARNYTALRARSYLVPIAGFGSSLGMYMIVGSMILGGATNILGARLAWIGLVLFSMGTLFAFVTLPVEFDASSRALETLKTGGFVSPDELIGARRVLNAAALTYVAAAVASLASLLYTLAALPVVLFLPARMQIRVAVLLACLAISYPVARGLDLRRTVDHRVPAFHGRSDPFLDRHQLLPI